jgi:hypothetical protein
MSATALVNVNNLRSPMSRKRLLTPVFVDILFWGFGAVVWAMTPLPAAAQCGADLPTESSCISCHSLQAPVYENGVWHSIHARKDCCANCHGGNCRAIDEDSAHQDMMANPLSDIYTNCHCCHPDDYMGRAEVFAVELGITLSSKPTPTPVSKVQMVVSPLVILPSPASSQQSTFPWMVVIGSLPIIILLLFGIIALVIHMRAKKSLVQEHIS